eukprot:4914397-Amphidinium_carterae.1
MATNEPLLPKKSAGNRARVSVFYGSHLSAESRELSPSPAGCDKHLGGCASKSTKRLTKRVA